MPHPSQEVLLHASAAQCCPVFRWAVGASCEFSERHGYLLLTFLFSQDKALSGINLRFVPFFFFLSRCKAGINAWSALKSKYEGS